MVAGDILQIRDYEVTTVTQTRVEWSDGTWEGNEETETAGRSHHTGIVNGSPDRNGRVATLEQNVPSRGRVVQNLVLYTQSVPTTTTTTHEQRRHPETNTMTPATVTPQVTITVSGRIWAYAPIQRTEDEGSNDE